MLTTVEAGRDIDAYKDEVLKQKIPSTLVQTCSKVIIKQQCCPDAIDVWRPLL